MTEYFSILPLGAGTQEIESFGSVFCRWSQAHSVSQYVMSRHLSDWWTKAGLGPPLPAPTIGINNAQFCSMGTMVESYVAAVAAATGNHELSRTTLLALAPAAPKNCIGYTRRIRTWCPACMHEAAHAGSPFYDRLAWALPPVERCAYHKVALVQSCPACGVVQRHYAASANLVVCWRCNAELLACSSSWEIRPQPGYGESQCLELVEAIATGFLVEAQPDAVQTFCHELREQLIERGLNYKEFYGEVVCGAKDRVTQRPTLKWMIRRAVVSQVRVSDMLTDPVGAARATTLLGLAPKHLSPNYRPKKSKAVVLAAEERLRVELARDSNEKLPPARHLVAELGVSNGFMEHRFPILWKAYKQRLVLELARAREDARQTASAFLRGGVLAEYPHGRFPTQKLLALHVAHCTGTNVAVARRAVETAVRDIQPRLGGRPWLRATPSKKG